MRVHGTGVFMDVHGIRSRASGWSGRWERKRGQLMAFLTFPTEFQRDPPSRSIVLFFGPPPSRYRFLAMAGPEIFADPDPEIVERFRAPSARGVPGQHALVCTAVRRAKVLGVRHACTPRIRMSGPRFLLRQKVLELLEWPNIP